MGRMASEMPAKAGEAKKRTDTERQQKYSFNMTESINNVHAVIIWVAVVTVSWSPPLDGHLPSWFAVTGVASVVNTIEAVAARLGSRAL